MWVWLFPPGMCCFYLGLLNRKQKSFSVIYYVQNLEEKN